MDFLFPDIDITNIEPFKIPLDRQIIDWIKQTNGQYTNELRQFLNLPKLDSRSHIVYNGPLTLAQQYWIICELSE
jgi:hypothetical protein